MTGKLQYLKIDYPKSAKGLFNVMHFEDNGFTIAYLPAFKLSGYGKNIEEANEMLLDHVLPGFMEELMKLPEQSMHEELAKYGWKRNSIFKKKFHSDAYVDKEGILRDFNLSPETKIKETLVKV